MKSNVNQGCTAKALHNTVIVIFGSNI